MKKLKRILLSLTILVMSTSFVSCTKPVEEKKVQELQGKINIWASKEDESILMDASVAFKVKHPKVEININSMEGKDIKAKFSGKLGGASEPDIITVNDYIVPDIIKTFPDEFSNVTAVSGYKKDVFLKNQIHNATYESKVYALPWYVKPIFMMYREDILEASNVKSENIKTWDYYNDLGLNVFAPKGKGMLSLNSFSDGSLYNANVNQLGLTYYDKNGKVNLLQNNNFTIANLLCNMYNSKIFYDDSKTGGKLDSFAKGNTLSLICDIGMINDMEKNHPDLKGKLSLEKLPAFEEGGNRDAISFGEDIMLTKSISKNEAALEFAKFLTMDTDFAVAEYKKYGNIPSNLSVDSDSNFYKKDDFYKKTSIGRLAIDEVDGLKDVQYTDDFSKIQNSAFNCVVDFCTANKDIKDSLTNAQKDFEK